MKAGFKTSFVKDLRNIRDKSTLKRIQKTIEHVEHAQSLADVTNLKKLKGGSNYYRVKVGDYRVGIIVEGNEVSFIRCLNRKEIYRYFP